MNEIEKKFLHELTRDAKLIKVAMESLVTEAYFQYPDTKNLFIVIRYYYEKYGQGLQSDTLQALLRLSQRLTAEEQARLSVLFEEVKLLQDFSNFEVLLEEMKSYYKIFVIKNSLDKSVSHLHDKAPDKALDQLKSDIVSLERSLNVAGIESGYFGSNAEEMILRYIDEKGHPEKYKGIELGYFAIDQVTNGLPKGSVTIVMGSQKSGKSVLMVNIAYHNLMKGKRVYYHVNEGGRGLVDTRLASRATGLVLDRINRRELTDEEFKRYQDFLRTKKMSKNVLVDSVPRSLSSASYIERKVREMELDGPVDLILIDYMTIMKQEDRSINQGWEKAGAIALDLKELATKMNIPILTIMHVNRKGAEDDKKHFDLEDMGLSYEPSKHVDLVMSWRVSDEEELKATRQGQGNLSIQASRFCGESEATLRINTNVMKIEQYDLSKILH